jgi:hypothetical protein
MSLRTLSRSFAGGEIAPELYGRVDLTKFQTGLAECKNFIVLPHGPVANRPGTEFIHATKSAANFTRLIPFSYSTTQTYVLEFGDYYVRFHTSGGTLLTGTVTAWVTATVCAVGDIRASSGTNYYCRVAHTSGTFATDLAASKWYALAGTIVEVPTPYPHADVGNLHYVQSADVLTIVHPSYAPRELRRLGATQWALTSITFTPSISAPTGVSVSASPASGSTSYKYKVTAVAADGQDESLVSAEVTATNNLSVAGNLNTVSWSAVTGAVRYNIYKSRSGLYGYIGQTGALSFVDDNISADMSLTPGEPQDPFSGSGNYPGAVSYFEQRRCFAGSTNKPQNLWLTRTATESNLNYSIPTKDSDAITVKIAAREANTIRHLVPLAELMLLTSGGEWKCSAGSADALSPVTIQIKPQSYMGASNVQPMVTGNSILYAQDRGARIREIMYSWEAQSYKTVDASIMAPHLFDGYEIVDIAYMRAPYQVLWALRSDGMLLGLTYVPDQQVMAWHQHPMGGAAIDSICVVAEGNEDVLYLAVNRTVNSTPACYIERMHTRQFSSQEDAFFVDCGLTYDSTPATTISGLDHLEAETVSILADGAVISGKVVTGGEVTLPAAASVVHIGLPITAQIITLPLAFETAGMGQGRVKNVQTAWLRVYRSSGVFAGPDADHLTEYRQRTSEVWGAPPNLKSDEIEIVLSPAWSRGGQIVVRHTDPLPLTISSLSLEVSVGG